MSKAIRITGIAVLVLLVLQMASVHHWGEAFAWIVALGIWLMACVQQSWIDDLQRKIGTLEKQRASICGDSDKIARDSNSHRVALPTKTGAAMNAPLEMPMELIVATFFRTVPTCLRIVREEVTGTAEISDATLANITVALFLFFLPDCVPYSDQENIYKMRRAFQTSWLTVFDVGGASKPHCRCNRRPQDKVPWTFGRRICSRRFSLQRLVWDEDDQFVCNYLAMRFNAVGCIRSARGKSLSRSG